MMGHDTGWREDTIVRHRQQRVTQCRLRVRGREGHLNGDLILAVLRCHLRRQLHGPVRVGDVKHDRRGGEIADCNLVACSPGKLQMIRVRNIEVRIRDTDVVDQTGIVVTVLGSQGNGVTPRPENARRNIERQLSFVLADKSHIAKVRSVQRHGDIMREA
jgi:hypothetical protein